jgi:hypothetical protein
MVMRMPASEVAVPALATGASHVTVGAIELARVALGFVLAGRDRFGAWAAMLVAIRVALRSR